MIISFVDLDVCQRFGLHVAAAGHVQSFSRVKWRGERISNEAQGIMSRSMKIEAPSNMSFNSHVMQKPFVMAIVKLMWSSGNVP
jgi:hypothetical protein